MATGAKEVAVLGRLAGPGEALRKLNGCSNWLASQSGRGVARPSPPSGRGGHFGEGEKLEAALRSRPSLLTKKGVARLSFLDFPLPN